MTLPGSITIGYLEEDAPQKAFFRIKPLFVKEDSVFECVENMRELFPDEGGIRIVPDKNESNRFKARMRTLGRYCMVDLTRHPAENDKIRPNKNYSPERQEFNRTIIYSDIVAKCPEEWLSEVVRVDRIENDAARAILTREPGTRHITLACDGKLTGPWLAAAEQGENEYSFALDPAFEPFAAEEGEFDRLFVIEYSEGDRAEVIATASGAPLFVARPQETSEGAEAAAQDASLAAPAPVESVHIPAATPPAVVAEVAPAPRLEAGARLRPAMKTITITPLNPRHKRGLAEVIDDGWRKSRLDQLGSPVPGDAGSVPVISPVERAEESMKAAWALPEARGSLLDGMLTLEGFTETMSARFGSGSDEVATSAQLETLTSLEERRLRLLSEIDTMKRQRLDARAKLMEEAREAHAERVKKMEEEIKRLTDECDARLRAAESARAAQAQAQKALNDEAEMAKFALQSRAAGLIHAWDGVDESDFAASPEVYAPNGAQLVSDVRKAFETCGRPMDNDEAVNLLACLTISPILVISGATGCGKTSLVRMLAAALGLTAPGSRRFIKLSPLHKPAEEEPLFKALTRYEDGRTLRLVLVDDANTQPHGDISRGLITYDEDKRAASTLRTVLTVQDDQIGYPLNARILDRAFMVRLPLPEAMDWNAADKEMPCAPRAAALEALRQIFDGEGDIPGEVEARLNRLLEALAGIGIHLSRRTLGDMRAYCASVIPLMTGAPKKALDFAFAQRALPAILASAPLETLRKLPDIICDLPASIALLSEPLAVPPM